MRVCTTVFGYGGGQAIVDRHLPLWRAASDEVLLVFPEDSPNTAPGVRVFATGRSNKYGEECLKRQLAGMRHTRSEIAADLYVFLEYDAFLLRRPEFRRGLQANVFFVKHAVHIEERARPAPGTGTYGVFRTRYPAIQGDRFYHFPWIFDAATLDTFLTHATLDPLEMGFVDRWLERQAAAVGIPVHNLDASREGFSRNTIRTPREKWEAAQRAWNGAYAFHGVKHPRLQNTLVALHRLGGFGWMKSMGKLLARRIHQPQIRK